MAKTSVEFKADKYYWFNRFGRHGKCLEIEAYRKGPNAKDHIYGKIYLRVYMALVSGERISFADFDIGAPICRYYRQMTDAETVLFADKRLNDLTLGIALATIKGNKGEFE